MTALLLVALSVLTALAGCNIGGNKEQESSENSDTSSTASPLTVVSEGQSEYVIVRSAMDNIVERQAITDLKNAIKKKYGVTLDIVDDSETCDKKAICVGNVNRESVISLGLDLGYNDYIIAVSGEDIVICGGSPEKLTEAVERFIGDHLAEEGTTLEIAPDLRIEDFKTEKRVDVIIGDKQLKEYVIVSDVNAIPSIAFDMELIHQHCVDNFGFGLKTVTTQSAGAFPQINAGRSFSRSIPAGLETLLAGCADNEGVIYFDGGNIWLTGNTDAAVREAILTFKEKYLDPSKARDGVLNVSAENKTCEFSDKEYTVMSFNVLFGDMSNGLTPQDRKDTLIKQIKDTSPDMLGVQECTEWWYEVLCEALGDEYDSVGELNDPKGQKWRNAIFYKKDKFELVETKTLWLSKTPTIKSKYIGSTQYRIMTYAVLKDKETGKVFAHANTHMGFEAEEKPHQWKYLIQLLDKIKYPMVLTGDFNSLRTETYHTQIREAGYWNALDVMTESANGSTIDFCFVTPESVHATECYSLPTEVDGIKPSDHPAVVTKFCLR